MYTHSSSGLLLIISYCHYYSYQSGIPTALAPALVAQIKPYLSTSDISLLSQALIVLALLLQLTPSTTFPEVEHDLFPDIYHIAHSPLVSGPALDSLLGFFSALVQADNQIATHVVPNLVIAVEKAPKSEASPANVARCVAQVVKSQQGVAAGAIAEYSKNIKVGVCTPLMNYPGAHAVDMYQKTSKAKPSLVVLSLLIVGELGRFMCVPFLYVLLHNALIWLFCAS